MVAPHESSMDAPSGQSTASLRDECERAAVVELRGYKRQRRLSAERLALELGCSADSAARWLRGDCRVPGWVVVAIRRAA
jgi:hypothetical protein